MKRIILLVVSLLNILQANSQTAGPNTAHTYTTDGSGESWANMMGAGAVDNNPAYVDLAQFPTCNTNMCYYSNIGIFSGFGFNIPAGSIITGIQLNIMQRVSSPGGGIHDSTLMLSVNGTTYGSDYKNDSNWFDTPHVRTYGGPTDLWGTTWTTQQINDPLFGISYRLTNLDYDQPASVDFMSMTVYYQVGNNVPENSLKYLTSKFENGYLLLRGVSPNIKRLDIEIRDITGKLVGHDYQYKDGAIQFETSGWSRGIYILNVRSEVGSLTRKLIFE